MKTANGSSINLRALDHIKRREEATRVIVIGIERAPFLGRMHNAIRIAPGGLAIGSPIKQGKSFAGNPVSLTEALHWLEVVEPVADGANDVPEVRKHLLAWAAKEIEGLILEAAV